MRHTLYIIASLLLLAACSAETEYPAELSIADSLADHGEPRAALSLLDSVSSSFESWSEPVQMRYALLKYKAQDKADVPITSDSTILPILHYYEQTQEVWLPEAYYYAARTYTELGDAPRALDCYQHAATEMEKEEKWKPQLARVYAQMGGLFSKRRLDNESIRNYHKSANLNEELKDSSSLVNIYSCLAGEFRYKNWDSVAFYNDLAMSIAAACRDTIWYLNFIKEKAGALVILGHFDEAQSLLYDYINSPITNKSISVYSVAARLYDSLSMDDSMEYCLRRMYEEGNIYAQKKASGKLAELYAKQGKNGLTKFFLSNYLLLEDSVDLLNNSQVVQEMQSAYNYNIYVRDNKELQQKEEAQRQRNQRLRIILIGILLFAGAFCFGIYERYKSQKYRTVAQITKLQSLTSAKIQSLESDLKQKEKQFSEVSDQNEFLLKDIELKRAEINSLKQQQTIQKSQLELERVKFSQTDVCQRLKKKGNFLKEEDIDDIESFFRVNNPEFLVSLRSLCTMKADEWTISLLIRMGFKQREIAHFIGKTESGISFTRKRLLTRIGRNDAKAEEWNRILEAL